MYLSTHCPPPSIHTHLTSIYSNFTLSKFPLFSCGVCLTGPSCSSIISKPATTLMMDVFQTNCSPFFQDGIYREVWSCDTTFQWEIPENPTRHSRWVLPPSAFHYSCLTPFIPLLEKIITFAIRCHFSNSVMVISHFKSARVPDTWCKLWCLTTECNWLNIWLFLWTFLLRHFVFPCRRHFFFLPGGSFAAGWNFSIRRKPF